MVLPQGTHLFLFFAGGAAWLPGDDVIRRALLMSRLFDGRLIFYLRPGDRFLSRK
jgi:hypothetical protein